MLHIVNKSPLGSAALRDCLTVCRRDDALLLIEDGVYAATGAAVEQLLAATASVHVLREDVNARGLAERIDNRIAIIDYSGFVQLCCDHHPIQSWY